ncbi:NAD(P)-binding protein [Thozetella sp. PMI_491]|nr:NAD(P)-binding protein [Thozetella sp. PMI_491]
MTSKTVYLVTGANKGIGRAVSGHLLRRPNTVVIATAREASAPALDSIAQEFAAHETSKLLAVVLDDEASTAHTSNSLPGTIATLAEKHPELGLNHIDVVIANAATSSGFKDILSTEPEELLRDLTVNAVGPAKLFRALWPLLEKSSPDLRKFVFISSSMGSIGCLDIEALPGTSYGMSKAAANWWAKKLSVDFKTKGLKVGILHPGWVKTYLGQELADAVGLAEPPTELDACAEKVLEQIDGLTLEKSGQFLTYKGEVLPW